MLQGEAEKYQARILWEVGTRTSHCPLTMSTLASTTHSPCLHWPPLPTHHAYTGLHYPLTMPTLASSASQPTLDHWPFLLALLLLSHPSSRAAGSPVPSAGLGSIPDTPSSGFRDSTRTFQLIPSLSGPGFQNTSHHHHHPMLFPLKAAASPRL